MKTFCKQKCKTLPLPPAADVQLLFACDSRDLIRVFPESWLPRILTRHPFRRRLPYLTSKGITSLVCTFTWDVQPPHFPRPLLHASEKLEGSFSRRGESRLEPSEEPDLDSASEPEGPLAITSRASSVTRPSSQAGKWQSQSQNAGSGRLVCSIFLTAP